MKQKLILHIIILLFILMYSAEVVAEKTSADRDSVLDDYAVFYGEIFEDGIGEIEDGNSFLNMLPEFKASDILKSFNNGEVAFTPKQLLEYFLRLLLGEVYSAAKLMAVILAMAVLSSYLSGLKSGFGENSVSTAAFYVCYIVTAGIAATVLEPTMLAIVVIVVPIVQYIFIPAVMISTALNIVNGMSDKFKTDRMVKLLNSVVKWGLSVILTIFVSLAGLKSIASAGADGLTIKLSKFAASNLVPMVGGILAESVETVMNCSVVIKNSVGILGIICLVLIALRPVLKLGAILILFRLTAAVAEPVSEPKLINCISRLADSVAVLFSIVVAVTVMFIIVVTILINAGTSAIMFGG